MTIKTKRFDIVEYLDSEEVIQEYLRQVSLATITLLVKAYPRCAFTDDNARRRKSWL